MTAIGIVRDVDGRVWLAGDRLVQRQWSIEFAAKVERSSRTGLTVAVCGDQAPLLWLQHIAPIREDGEPHIGYLIRLGEELRAWMAARCGGRADAPTSTLLIGWRDQAHEMGGPDYVPTPVDEILGGGDATAVMVGYEVAKGLGVGRVEALRLAVSACARHCRGVGGGVDVLEAT